MTPGFVIAILFCAGGSCEAVQAEPGTKYTTIESCRDALAAKAATLQKTVEERKDGRQATPICLQEAPQPITEVESVYDVLDTSIVHAEPRVDSDYVGSVESGQHALVTGLVTGTSWLRVLLPDGTTGFVFGDHLRKPGSSAAAAPMSGAGPATTPPPSVAAVPSPAPRLPRPSSPAQEPAPAAAIEAPAHHAQTSEFRDCPNCPTMVPLPGGSFVMGSRADPSERPEHRVTVPPFALGKFKVTVAEWNACAADGGCEYKPPTEDNAEDRPAMNLSWEDASQYVQWLRKVTGKPYRLPTEAEWEYAARAGTRTRYSWGDQVGTGNADCEGCGGPREARSPTKLGAFPANPWGLFGMEGGIAEWVEDCWHASYKGAPADGSAWRSSKCSSNVLRGGSWESPPADITVSSRNFYDPTVRYPANGMRVALGSH
ncbi:MAG: SUMF1/EgtB/PvdO family nonheme iron enzyme [Acetobacteraceae bacterium]|nr:SUMF1/EgtB/PvdO family nonheme iron enzyme [Acetobacteraceae bacterium]